jgi:aspartyl-tRNA(Asn)/glutamyl-tRNA(Gln) amidotransferase subunit A
MTSLRTISEALKNSETSVYELIETALARADSSKSVFVELNHGLLSLAESIDKHRLSRKASLPLAGIPITLKHLFNLRNERTLAGSLALKNSATPKDKDADVIAPLREAGLLFLGRTNMSEFAFSGMGINPHYGTPLSIWDRQVGRIPGGSSSGSAVSVAEGIVAASIGSDTAGSCRVPAAFNGIVGVKPSYGRMSLNGIFPLSPSSDAPGPIANDVDSCYILDQLMCGKLSPKSILPTLAEPPISSLNLAIPDSLVLSDLDPEVQAAFDLSIDCLRSAGADIQTVAMPAIDRSIELFLTQAVVLHEAYQNHKGLLETFGDEYDPFVRDRILTGSQISETNQQDRYRAKALVVEQFRTEFKDLAVDALLYPTVSCIPPALSETVDTVNARSVNLRCLRNTVTANYFDGCSISLPCHKTGEAPVGLMVSAMNGQDEHLYSVAARIEKALLELR